MEASSSDNVPSKIEYDDSHDSFKHYIEPVLKLIEKELFKLYEANVKLKMKNKILKKKLGKSNKKTSIDLDTLRTSIFKRRSLNSHQKTAVTNEQDQQKAINDSIGEIVGTNNDLASHQLGDLKLSRSMKILQKPRTIANRLGLDNKPFQNEITLHSHVKIHDDITWNINSDIFPNNKYLIFTCSADCTCKVISIDDESDGLEFILTYSGHNSSVNSMSYNLKTPGLMCTGCGDGSIHLWSYRSLYDKMVGDEDNTTVASGNILDNNIKKISKQITSPLINIKSHELPVSTVQWNRNGVNFLSASWDENIKIWDSDKQICLKKLHGHNNEVTTAHYGTAENTIISGSADSTIRIWDIRSPIVSVKICHAHNNVVTSVKSFHCNEYYMASSGKDKIIRIWDQRNLSQYVHSSKFGSPINKISLTSNDSILCIPEDNGHIWLCNSKLHRLCQLTTSLTKKHPKTSIMCCDWMDHSSNLNLSDSTNKSLLDVLSVDNTGYMSRWKVNIANKITCND